MITRFQCVLDSCESLMLYPFYHESLAYSLFAMFVAPTAALRCRQGTHVDWLIGCLASRDVTSTRPPSDQAPFDAASWKSPRLQRNDVFTFGYTVKRVEYCALDPRIVPRVLDVYVHMHHEVPLRYLEETFPYRCRENLFRHNNCSIGNEQSQCSPRSARGATAGHQFLWFVDQRVATNSCLVAPVTYCFYGAPRTAILVFYTLCCKSDRRSLFRSCSRPMAASPLF